MTTNNVNIETAVEHTEHGRVYKDLHVTLLSLAGILFEIIALICLVGVLLSLIYGALSATEETTVACTEGGALDRLICMLSSIGVPIVLFMAAIVAAPIGFVLLRTVGSAPPLSFKLSGLDPDTIRNLELFIGVLTLVVIAGQSYLTLEQAKHTAENVEIIKRNTEFDEHKLLNQHLQLINRTLIDPNDTDKLYESYASSRAEVLAYMLLADYETFYEMSADMVMSEDSWCRVYELARLAAKNDETLQKLWSDKTRGPIGKTERFREFFDCLTNESKDDSPTNSCVVSLNNGGTLSCDKQIAKSDVVASER